MASVVRSLAAFAAVATLASSANAQEEGPRGLGQQGNFFISAERLFGFTGNKQSIELNGNESDVTFTTFGLLWNAPASPMNLPRVGLDYMVVDNVSVGGNLGYVSTSIDTDGPGDDDATGFLFAPRAGYLLGIGESVGIWARGGFTYYSLQDPDTSQFALNAELQFAIAPTPGLAITVGPLIDFGLTGSRDVGSEEADFTDRNYGVVAGLSGVL